MKREKVFKIGIGTIFLAVFLNPTSYLLVGKVERGEVVEVVYQYSVISFLPTSSYARIQFKYQDKTYIVLGNENQVFLVGDKVKVIFYKWEPQKAKIYTFWSLMMDSIIELPLGLLIWWALFKSFPDLYSTSISKREYAKLLIKGKLHKREQKLSESPKLAKYIVYPIVVSIILCFIFGLYSIIAALIAGKITYKIGIGLSIVIIAVLFTVVHKIVKG